MLRVKRGIFKGARMSVEFDKLAALLHLAEPSERSPRIDLLEAAKLAARWGWLARRAREQLVDAHGRPSARGPGPQAD
jgi:hypothetical protein